MCRVGMGARWCYSPRGRCHEDGDGEGWWWLFSDGGGSGLRPAPSDGFGPCVGGAVSTSASWREVRDVAGGEAGAADAWLAAGFSIKRGSTSRSRGFAWSSSLGSQAYGVRASAQEVDGVGMDRPFSGSGWR